jgi:hypothetical protein
MGRLSRCVQKQNYILSSDPMPPRMVSVAQKSEVFTKTKHTTGGIPRWSPTLVLVARFSAYVWQSGRDAQFSLTYGRMCLVDL